MCVFKKKGGEFPYLTYSPLYSNHIQPSSIDSNDSNP